MSDHNHSNPGMFGSLPRVRVETTEDLRQSIAVSRERDLDAAVEHLRQAIAVLDSGCGGLKASVVRENIVAALRSLGGEG